MADKTTITKDDQDWLDVLAGKKPSGDANQNTVEDASFLRAFLLVQDELAQQQIHSPSMLEKLKDWFGSFFFKSATVVAYTLSIIVATTILIPLRIHTEINSFFGVTPESIGNIPSQTETPPPPRVFSKSAEKSDNTSLEVNLGCQVQRKATKDKYIKRSFDELKQKLLDAEVKIIYEETPQASAEIVIKIPKKVSVESKLLDIFENDYEYPVEKAKRCFNFTFRIEKEKIL